VSGRGSVENGVGDTISRAWGGGVCRAPMIRRLW
jgi:hypothetical protein